jgi:hypothetical protein
MTHLLDNSNTTNPLVKRPHKIYSYSPWIAKPSIQAALIMKITLTEQQIASDGVSVHEEQ